MCEILVVDQDEKFVSFVGNIIKSKGHTFSYVKTNEEGFVQITEKPPKAIFLNIDLPDGWGWKLGRIAKRQFDIIIFVVSKEPDNYLNSYKELIDGIVKKNGSLETIASTVKELVESV